MSISKQVHCDFANYAPVQVLSTGGAAAGGDNTVEMVQAGPYTFEVRFEQACTDITFTRTLDANTVEGWLIPNDKTDNEGFEMTMGILASADRIGGFKIGTDPAFFAEIKFGIPDVSEYDVCAFGFRKAGAYVDAINTPAALYAAYDDKALVSVEAADYHIVNSLNGSDEQTDIAETNASDDDTVTIRIDVSAAGVVTYAVNSTAYTPTTALTFDSTDIVIPTLIVTRGAILTDDPLVLKHWACGLA